MLDARQYTVPVEAALSAVSAGEEPTLTTRQKHTRECFVVAEEGADLARIEREIVTMPNYFADYDTTDTCIECHCEVETLPAEVECETHVGLWKDRTEEVVVYNLCRETCVRVIVDVSVEVAAENSLSVYVTH